MNTTTLRVGQEVNRCDNGALDVVIAVDGDTVRLQYVHPNGYPLGRSRLVSVSTVRA